MDNVTQNYTEKFILENKIEKFPGGIFVYSAENDEQFAFVSENMLIMLGYTKQEFEKKFSNRFSQMIYWEDRKRALKDIDDQISKGNYDTCFYRIEKSDGTLIWVHDEGHVVADQNGKRWFYVIIVDITATVKAREHLSNQYNELHQIIDHVPASILVLKKVDDQVTVATVNQAFCDITETTYDDLVKYTSDGILHLFYPTERDALKDFFDGLFSGEKQRMELTHRLQKMATNTYQWVRCSAIHEMQDNGTSLIYAVFTDATLQKMKEQEFNRITQQLLVTNPDALCAFRLNLTTNHCSDAHGASLYIRQLLQADTADEVLENICNIITTKEEVEQFRNNYNRQKLRDEFEAGRDQLSSTYRRLTSEGELHWVTTYFNTLRNPFTDDIETIVYSVDTDDLHKKEQINEIITGEEYDYIGLLHIGTQHLKFYYVSDVMESISFENITHDQNASRISEWIQSETERAAYLQAIKFETILKTLETQPVYLIAYFYTDTAGKKRKKQLSFRYLDYTHQEILFARSDVTAVFEEEEKSAELLRRALLNAERANELKSEFLGNVSHDIRTPLNAIIGYNKLAMEASEKNMKDLYLQKIDVASNTLLSLINDTLDLQKIENGTAVLKPELTSCNQLINSIVTSVRPLMEKKQLDFIVDTSKVVPKTVNVDVVRLRQVFINLLSNSVKFTPEHGQVEFIVECKQLDNNHTCGYFIVRDTGIGMSPDFLGKIYEPFSQERTEETAHIGGSGLGLSIVKRIIDMMGGHIEAKSELGKGSEFTVILEFEAVHDNVLTTVDEESSNDIAGTHILLCEDNAMNMEIAKTILELKGVTVTEADNGLLGFKKFYESAPGEYDLILMDIRMPIMNGYEATEKIRKSDHSDAQSIPILALTADAYVSDVDKARSVGMDGHVAKPIDVPQMVNAIARLVGKNKNKLK